VKVKGQITSRWQMDEYEGTLRVISQPWQWWNGSIPPSLETFTVASSQAITPLAKLQMTLPEREQLMSVRFDGERGYAVTAIQTDPLFTFDLSDPAAPKQLGELVMPGFLYHMEPRGDRLLALGYDQGNAEGAITVSLFDVSDLSAPTMIERVNFGGNWGQLPEDQDRIHKVFNIDQENELILVPYSGYSVDEADDWCGRSLNGVQLVDFVGDDLALRGTTTSLGQARRAFVAGGSLFTVADQEVAAYDLADRDQPAQLSGAPLALNVSLTLPTGDKLVRLRQDWYSDDVRLEVVEQTSADAMVAPVTFNLTDYLRAEHGREACRTWYPSSEPLLAVGDTVWTLINDYGAWDTSGKEDQVRTLMVGFSTATGEVTGSLALPFVAGYWGWGNTSRVVRGDVALLLQEGWDEQGQTRTLVAVDLSDASKPRQAYAVPLPADDYYASTGMLESGDEIVTSYAERVPGKEEVLRHYALRIGVADPLVPTLIGSYNVPGYVVDFDAATETAVTLDHQPMQLPGSSYEDCAEKLPTGWYDESARACRGHSSTLHRVSLAASKARVLDSARRDELAWSTPRRGDGRLFFTQGYYGGLIDDVVSGPGGYYGGWSWPTQNITVVDSATLAGAAIEVPGVWQVVASGQSLVLAPSAGQPLSVIDAADAEQPQLVTGDETALGYTNHLSISGKDVFLSQGDGGVQHMTMP
ncbi:MAG TPA: beta-propeller domain-containing protein, partial [Polyangiaceae bacterium]|nr:beta-propeller domain-containing protein [Polyangiaceae bacterium]